jgi:hypothetical protein
MRQHIEIISRASSIKETRTAKGYIYSFGLPITGQSRDGEELTEWMRCSIFQKERRPDLLDHQGEFHIIGELQPLPAWGDYPQKIGLWGFYIEPVLGRVWRIAKSRKKREEKSKPSSLPADEGQPFPEVEDETGGGIPF